MTYTRFLLATCVATFALFGSACGGGTSNAPVSYDGPIGSTDAAAGETAFSDFCSGCHREGGKAPSVQGLGMSPAAMRKQIREGSGKMPAFPESHLAAAELEAMLAYLVTTGAVQSEGGAGL